MSATALPTRSGTDLRVRIGALTLAGPVLAASGTYGYGDEFGARFALDLLGGIVTKTVTLRPRAGNPPHRMVETPGGMLNSIGLENVGLKVFLAEKLPKLALVPTAIVASIGGETPGELARLVAALESAPCAGYEINYSCPNVARGGARYWADARRLEKATRKLRALTARPLIAKLTPNATDPALLARACEAGGADGVSLVNTFIGTAIDLERREFMLGRASGGLSGPAIKPMALAQVHEVSGAVSIPVIGMGGIVSAIDALEFLVAGAACVQVGTASFARPDAPVRVARGIAAWCAARGVRQVGELVRTVRVAGEQGGEGGDAWT
jgi:dihydroorotate dehydrogenase (NAD+) catalytic subunit